MQTDGVEEMHKVRKGNLRVKSIVLQATAIGYVQLSQNRRNKEDGRGRCKLHKRKTLNNAKRSKAKHFNDAGKSCL